MNAEAEQIIGALKEYLPKSQKLLFAVSGGLDSVVLLDAAHAISRELEIEIEVAHVDHSLRSNSSEDAEFVRVLAQHMQVTFHLHVLTPPKGDVNIEAWGREERYRYFSSLLVERNGAYVVTAHHANDQAETVLMRFLANREPTSIHGVDDQRKVLRPFLSLTRERLVAYAQARGVKYREDPSNGDINFLRNRYRQRIIPFLEKELNSDLIRVLSNRAESLEDDASALEALARSALEPCAMLAFGSKEWFRALRDSLTGYAPAVGWRIVERVLAERYGSFFGRRTSLRVLGFMIGDELAIEIPGGRRIQRARGGVEFL